MRKASDRGEGYHQTSEATMHRFCAHCYREFTPADFVKEESREMEAERRAHGLEGVRFLYYRCPDCDFADIFVDIHPLPGEGDEQFQRRRDALEVAARKIHAQDVKIVLMERTPQG
jgi:hypothetical protein